MKNSKFPSKSFLTGEYAVLQKGKALILACEPFFQMSFSSATENRCPFSVQSEAGLYWQAHEKFFQNYNLKFQDPHAGRGGFGASGAEFLSLYAVQESKLDPWAAYRAYKKITAQIGSKASGADLLAQATAQERNALVFLDLEKETLELLPLPKKGKYILSIFHTGKKLATHEHLSRTERFPPLAALNALTDLALSAWKETDIPRFAQALNEYGDLLDSYGLLAPHSQEIVQILRAQGALAAKGCGAMGADVVLAITEKPLENQKNLSKVFETQI